MIRFGVNHKLATLNIRRLRRRLIGGGEIGQESLLVQEQIKTIISAKLKDPSLSKRDPSATIRGFNLSINVIVAAITTGLIKRKFKIISGTGVAEKMDSADPLLQTVIPRILKPRSRLWRILEYGALPHDILARNTTIKPEKRLTKRPKGAGITRTGRLDALNNQKTPKASKKQAPQLRFFWRRALTGFKGPLVHHPGQTGRGIWKVTASFEARRLFRAGMSRVLKRIVASHSGR